MSLILEGKKILVVGASSDIADSLNGMLINSGATIGLHYNKNRRALSPYRESESLKKFQKRLRDSKSCQELVDSFVKWAKGIDGLIQLSGDIRRPMLWERLTDEDWSYDLSMNLVMPFFLAQRAAFHMRERGGRIILMSTASASHGGGSSSLAYGVAKAGVECIVKGLARDCAACNILVNAVAPGFVLTKFHTGKMKRTKTQLQKRIETIPLKRAGSSREFAETVIFLLSEGSSYITGQVIAVSGGDWL